MMVLSSKITLKTFMEADQRIGMLINSNLDWKRSTSSVLYISMLTLTWAIVQGVVIHSDVTMGHNTMAFVQHAHVNTSTHNFTPTGKQRSFYLKLHC